MKIRKMSYKILAKYIKDLKFEIPNTETYFEFSKEIAKYKINIDIKSKELKKKIIEVETCLHLKPHETDTGKLKSNIVYNTIIQLDEDIKEISFNGPDEKLKITKFTQPFSSACSCNSLTLKAALIKLPPLSNVFSLNEH